MRRTLKMRAAAAGMSLSEYLRCDVVERAQRPTLEEVTVRIRKRTRIALDVPVEEIIRVEREARERHVAGR